MDWTNATNRLTTQQSVLPIRFLLEREFSASETVAPDGVIHGLRSASSFIWTRLQCTSQDLLSQKLVYGIECDAAAGQVEAGRALFV